MKGLSKHNIVSEFTSILEGVREKELAKVQETEFTNQPTTGERRDPKRGKVKDFLKRSLVRQSSSISAHSRHSTQSNKSDITPNQRRGSDDTDDLNNSASFLVDDSTKKSTSKKVSSMLCSLKSSIKRRVTS